MTILGIDPGISGGVAHICKEGVHASPMPVLDGAVDIRRLANIIAGIKPDLIVIERVGTRPGQSTVATLTTGVNYGRILGMCEARLWAYEEVQPSAWKKALGIARKDKSETTKQLKERAIAKVQQLYPTLDLLATERSKVPHDGMAEAVLVAHWRMTCRGML